MKTSIKSGSSTVNISDVRIMDMACGVGAVAEEIAMYGYKNVDGLDPIKGYLEAAQSKGIFLLVKKDTSSSKGPMTWTEKRNKTT